MATFLDVEAAASELKSFQNSLDKKRASGIVNTFEDEKYLLALRMRYSTLERSVFIEAQSHIPPPAPVIVELHPADPFLESLKGWSPPPPAPPEFEERVIKFRVPKNDGRR